jgi:hypothetical protein
VRSIEVTDFLSVEQRAAVLGVRAPDGFCILPRHFERAGAVSDLCHESSAFDLKSLFRQEGIPGGEPLRIARSGDLVNLAVVGCAEIL